MNEGCVFFLCRDGGRERRRVCKSGYMGFKEGV